MNYWQKANYEIEQALQARKAQNEGRARVCARRAAGQAIQGFFAVKHFRVPTINSFSLLNDDSIRINLPVEIYPILDHLVLRVDGNHNLPEGIDLLIETKELISKLKKMCSIED